ncbi:unnamed protein product [Cylicocyclus nassatus]|uniref:Protein quiver n=1 Tax=Cylicocyclus nassatus TaxID=53992 RepID=A0AA36GIA1_CYLNA|nr:unnamed protein product [Cylicocyclus nassatus]
MMYTTTYAVIALLAGLVKGLKMECFSCRSNEDWSFYTERIPGLKISNVSDLLPLSPLECIFDPLRIYADRTSSGCKGHCMKWTSAKILEDGGLEVNMLRGCVDAIMDPTFTVPDENRCYQSPDHFTHQVGIEYRRACFCKGYMCNEAANQYSALLLTIIVLFFLGANQNQYTL